jgi:hypothetical protein
MAPRKKPAPAPVVETPEPTPPEPGSPFTYDPAAHVIIGDYVYAREAITPDASGLIGQINWTDQELANIQQTGRLLVLGRERLMEQLFEALEETPALAVSAERQPAELPFEDDGAEDEGEGE